MTDLRAPKYLSRDTAAVWRQVVAHLRSNGTLLAIDASVIETFSFAVIRQRRLTAELDKAKLFDKHGRPHAALRVLEATAATVKNLSHVLGLNPLARKALPSKASKPKGTNNPWRGVLE